MEYNPFDPWRRMLRRSGLLALAFVIFFLGFVAGFTANKACAHDTWGDGKPVSPQVKAQCCGDADSHLLGSDDYFIDKDGFHILALDAVVPLASILPSPDGNVWAFWNNHFGRKANVYCVFWSGGV